MANKKILLGMLAITLVFGLMVVACDAGGDLAINGTWKSSDGSMTYKFAAGAFEVSAAGTPVAKGTYEARGGTLTMTMTHVSDGAGWVTVAEAGVSETTQTYTYTISGRTLTLTYQGQSVTLTKQ
jgi:uncharacterized lipoprotein YehR (DUF1307 family)